LAACGLELSDAIRLYLQQVVAPRFAVLQVSLRWQSSRCSKGSRKSAITELRGRLTSRKARCCC
jgi:hypothetical protein